MLLPGAPQVDHINHDTLDNRRANLREATTSQNKMNERRRKDNTSGFKGVAWHKGRRKWCAHIGKDRVKYYLGYFLVVEDAARAYDAEARKRFGEFACVNFPIKQETKNIDKET
jgi:hypothetical protein